MQEDDLALDCCAFHFYARSAFGMRGPLLAWRVGHFAVVRSPDGAEIGMGEAMMPWGVYHVATQVQALDFATPERAWQFADEISIACGDRIDHEPSTLPAFFDAVPDVLEWIRRSAGMPKALTGGLGSAMERPFLPFHRVERWVEAA